MVARPFSWRIPQIDLSAGNDDEVADARILQQYRFLPVSTSTATISQNA